MDHSIDIIPAGLVLKDKEAHAIELIASGSDVHFAEIMSGLRSGSINAAGAKAREAHNTGRKVSDFGKALLALKAAQDVAFKRAEMELIVDGSEAAKVALLKERSKSERESPNKEIGAECPTCSQIDFQAAIARAYKLATQRRKGRK
ncbi:MAG: hypothetical protein P8K76_18485 [Candidatus Binatia bacterium]|nr:hypothetical protein [Candidatus Binatia bacterium]